MTAYEYLYRVRITEYPEGALKPLVFGTPDEYRVHWDYDDDWSPPGWKPSRRYIAITGRTSFSWPKAGTPYRRRTTAESRGAARILRRKGHHRALQRNHLAGAG